jgi:hypothetical protein
VPFKLTVKVQVKTEHGKNAPLFLLQVVLRGRLFWCIFSLASVTHDFGQVDGVLMMVYSGSQQELALEKSDIHVFP